MKKIVVALIVLTASVNSFTQGATNPDAPMTKQDYLKKSRSQKTFAWVLLGAGTACFVAVAPGNTSFDALGTIIIAGGIAVVSSIPLFIASAKNKKRAMAASASVDIQKIQQSPFETYVYRPALSFKLKI